MRNHALAVLGLSLACASSASAQGFGSSLAVSGADVLIGAPASNRAPGTVFVYRKTPAGRWTQRAALTAGNAAVRDGFGSAMAADSDLVVVTARGGSGSAYVLRRDRRTASWNEVAQLVSADAREGDAFGQVVALSGDWAAVAAPAKDSGSGAVYMFRRSGETWTAAGKLVADDRAARDRFGASLAILGDRLLVGAPGRERGTGTAYTFVRAGDSWRQDQKLVPNVALAANSGFGTSLAFLSPTRILVGSPNVDAFAGAIYAMRRDSNSGAWRDELLLRSMEQARGMRFGATIRLDGDDLLVGAPGASSNTGRVYRMRRDSAHAWTDASMLRADSLDRFYQFGNNVAVGGGIVAVSIPGADQGAGRVAIYDRDRTGAARAPQVVWAEVAPLSAVTGGERRCSAVGAEAGTAESYGCRGMDLLSFLPIPSIGGRRGTNLNDIWGWVDPTTRREYALVGRTNGTSFVDVTNPANPIYLGDLPMTDSARAASWRDIKVYRDHAFIVADGSGPHGMQVFDLTQLRGIRAGRPQMFRPTALYTRINSAHNIVINEESGFAYAVGAGMGGETCGGGLHMIDIRDPQRPTFAGCFADTQTGRSGTGYSHDAQCVTYRGPDATYRGHEICIGSNETALSIADVTDKTRPVALSRASYPNVGYAHQGWLTPDHRYFYLDDELDELAGTVPGTRTLIWDLADLDDPVLVGAYQSNIRSIDHNLYIRGDTLYASNYSSGLRMLDISNRAAPREIGFFDTVPWGPDQVQFEGSWSNYPFFPSGNIIVSSIGEGLFVIRARTSQPVP